MSTIGINTNSAMPLPDNSSVDNAQATQVAQTGKAASKFDVPNDLPPVLTGPANAPTLEAPVQRDFEGLVMLLQQAKSKLTDEMSKATSEEIRNKSDIKKEQNEKLQNKMEEQWDKIADAKHKSKIGRIFGIIGKIAAVIGSAALACMTGGAACGVLIAVTVVAANDLASTISVEAGGPDFSLQAGATAVGKAMYPNDEEMAQKAGMIMGITLTVAIAIAGLAAGVYGVQNSAEVLEELPALCAKVAVAAGVIGGAANATSGGINIASAADQRDADQLGADQVDIKKFLAKLQALMEEDSDRLQEIVEQAQDSVQKVASMISSTAETKMQITRRMI